MTAPSGRDAPTAESIQEATMSEETLTGGCLCGAVTYEVSSPFTKFGDCFCSRCRRATGSAHATALYADPGRFRWLTGAALVVRYDLPTARSFATAFCSTCGAPLPHATRSGREMVVPAGSLNADPRTIRPGTHVFWESRAPWSCGDADRARPLPGQAAQREPSTVPPDRARPQAKSVFD